ncbi:EpsG family protein [Flavobacteriaceae bacterium XHP0103]|uniref:EpsG family protein n=1 Tax=Marixanthotalea marina TaxID=2844359 RepID=UPI002989C72F|nr:EpsG family protein [Marixanthotalea marina]MBU3822286.1 EpsG family protein [Marixanthotalea marina]
MNYSSEAYLNTFKIVLAVYILFGTFVLKALLYQKKRLIRNDKGLLIIFVLFLIAFVGFRNKYIGTDTINYFNYYFTPVTSLVSSYFEVFTRLKSDFLFEILVSFSYWHKNFTVFLLTVAIVMNVSLYIFVRKFTDFGNKGSSLILFLTLASSFSFMSIEINIIRNGLSICFILLGIYSLLEKEIKKFIIFALIAFLFHRTAIIPIVLILAVYFSDKIEIKYYIVFYVLVILLSFIGFGFHSIQFLAEFDNEDLQKLRLVADTTYRIGFRYDFVLYNSFFLFLFFKFTNGNYKDLFLIKYFILSSAVFFLNFYIPFSDRFGIYSWIVIPLLLFNTINDAFPTKKVFISTIVLIGFYVLNHVILFPSW